jgi:hypothetical protein
VRFIFVLLGVTTPTAIRSLAWLTDGKRYADEEALGFRKAMAGTQQRRIVYFLGAGASYGAGAYTTVQHGGRVRIPMQATFWEIFLRLCKTKEHRREIESFLFRYFLGYAKAPGRSDSAARRRMFKGIDVEEVFTFLSERNHAPRTSVSFQAYTKRVWEALLSEIGHVFKLFEPNADTIKVFQAFRRNHVRHWDVIVSFNYDVVFEYSLPWNYVWIYAGIDQSDKSRPLRVLKPHGSINWEEINGTISAEDDPTDFPEKPVVVAPTHLKFIGTGEMNHDVESSVRPTVGYLNQSEQISDIWGAMEKAMRGAKGLVFIGYSFPSSDLYFSSVLRSVLASRQTHPFIMIVNPDSMDIQRRLHSRFAIPLDRIRTFPDLQAFNQVTRSQVLRMFG